MSDLILNLIVLALLITALILTIIEYRHQKARRRKLAVIKNELLRVISYANMTGKAPTNAQYIDSLSAIYIDISDLSNT